jgi:hypothetical protein
MSTAAFGWHILLVYSASKTYVPIQTVIIGREKRARSLDGYNVVWPILFSDP